MVADATYILGLDYGSKRVGVAIASSIARLPRPVATLATTDTIFDEISQLIVQEKVDLVVVGLPRTMDGGYSAQTHAAETFQKTLAQQLSVPVVLSDETLTSVDAETVLGKKGSYAKADVDALAATYILERYLAEHPAGERVV